VLIHLDIEAAADFTNDPPTREEVARCVQRGMMCLQEIGITPKSCYAETHLNFRERADMTHQTMSRKYQEDLISATVKALDGVLMMSEEGAASMIRGELKERNLL
jgi:hypothetical protein